MNPPAPNARAAKAAAATVMRSARNLMRERFELLGVSLVIAAFLVRRLDW
jgi:hypothetical protein